MTAKILSGLAPTSASAAPTPIPCLEHAAPTLLPPRSTPLEVKFISDGNIWIWQENAGSARQITQTGDARSMYFSPDGKVIAFERGVDVYRVELWAVNRDGKNLRRLVSVEQFNAMGSDPDGIANVPIDVQWIPHTHTFTFRVRPELNAIGYIEYPGKWAVDADTTQLRKLKPPDVTVEPGSAVRRIPSPDGRYVAIVTENNTQSVVSLENADGTNRRENLLTMPQIGLGHYSVSGSLFWSRDSKSLRAIVPAVDALSGGPGNSFTTWIIPVQSDPRPLRTFFGFPVDVYLSPNQEYLGFWRPTAPLSNERELHLAKFDGSKEIIYATGHVLEFKGWAPDSVYFAFWFPHSHQMQFGSICGDYAPLTDAPVAYGIEWVDGTRFLYASGTDRTRELRLGRIGGTSVVIASSFAGDYATYQYNHEAAAVGQ